MTDIGAAYFVATASARRVHDLIETIAEELLNNPAIKNALDACELQPTTRAAGLAAASAVNVILAHELGQEVAADEGYRPDDLPLAGSGGDLECVCGHVRRQHDESLAVRGGFICNEPGCDCEMFLKKA